MAKPFKPQLRLVIQASIPLVSDGDGISEYENLKVFLLAISPDITLNGQIVKALEPCCKKQKETKNDEKGPTIS